MIGLRDARDERIVSRLAQRPAVGSDGPRLATTAAGTASHDRHHPTQDGRQNGTMVPTCRHRSDRIRLVRINRFKR
jgi:hypothetical protein